MNTKRKKNKPNSKKRRGANTTRDSRYPSDKSPKNKQENNYDSYTEDSEDSYNRDL
jgi:hypothetical protein